VIDEEGFVKLTGRCKDIIIRGGVNISPAEIEKILLADERIRDVACVGIPDKRLGERVCACVVPENERDEMVLEDLVELAEREGLAKNKWPQSLVLLDSLPMNSSGKLRRSVLRETVIKQMGWQKVT